MKNSVTDAGFITGITNAGLSVKPTTYKAVLYFLSDSNYMPTGALLTPSLSKSVFSSPGLSLSLSFLLIRFVSSLSLSNFLSNCFTSYLCFIFILLFVHLF